MAKQKKNSQLPQVTDLLKPTVQALIELGGSGNIEEINEGVYQLMKLPETVLAIPHGKDGRSEVDYRLAWARTVLKRFGLLDNSSRKVWTLTNPNVDIQKINGDEIDKSVRATFKLKEQQKKLSTQQQPQAEIEIENEEIATWKEQLLDKLYSITPNAFERLTQRLLRESGFIQVEVTGKTGDGGIDGKGIVRINGFLSFHVIFQCKRYRSSVTPSMIRDFRGAMQGRADKGLFVTTGAFTRDAIKEATRDGAPPIDLIDGELLCEKLKELKLGIEIELIENVKIKTDWFDNL